MTRINVTVLAGAALCLLIASACSKKDSEPTGSEEFAGKVASPEEVAGSDKTETAPSMPAQNMMGSLRASCPLAADGTTVEVTNTETGVALTFTTDTEDVDELRQRAKNMAQMYEMHGGHGQMMWHQMGHEDSQGHMMGGGGMGQGHMANGTGPMPAATARTEDVEKGARIVLTPKDTSQLAALREHVKFHRERMRSGECWMLQNDARPGAEGQ